ncbi:probable methylated-DNA-[protein]-cysteine S-methyltransferase [Nitrococcus mobilis Nb-231]|uniref:methylated-DNA--[protein]-cysteine S-methyltransferase n=2 Tax=Nitrococcus mobilis TaxID=35797 RepID=A4BUS3_9GAMM|nr:probable methylated-DNA-[protein]-cysteine S-methyltransferase [Nitrococcus mobilis Nb-231]
MRGPAVGRLEDERVNSALPGDYDVVVAAPFGAIAVRCEAAAITELELLSRAVASTRAMSGFAAQVTAELEAYLRDGQHRLALPVRANGTAFQRRVWERLRRIPAGGVCTYGALAQDLRTSARAIGGACRANPVPLVVPCHRVIAAGGIGGFAGFLEGSMLAVKSWLLEHERN